MKPVKMQQNCGGWTLVEILVSISILLIITAIVYAAVASSREDSKLTRARASAKTINEAIIRAHLKRDTNSLIYGEDADDIVAAVNYLKNKGYIE